MPKPSGPNLTTQAYDRIREDVLTGACKAGEKININETVGRLGFSLAAVREALSKLSSEGLVVSEANKGYRVAAITQAELEDLTRTRILIEGECLANAIRHGDLKWESAIVSTLFELSRLSVLDPQNPAKLNPVWNSTHSRFHAALVAACDSPWLLRLRELLYIQTERYRVASAPLEPQNRDLAAEHKAIADAALDRDSDRAIAALTDHLLKTTQILIAAKVTQPVPPIAASDA